MIRVDDCCCGPSLCNLDVLSFHSATHLHASLRSLKLQRRNSSRLVKRYALAPTEDEPSYLITAHGWNVRDVNARKQKELYDIARIQSDAFQQPSPVFNDFFYDLFKAEVLSALAYKLRLSPPRRYTCLVSETEAKEMVGVVDLTALSNSDILKHLHGADEYLYVSGLAVDADYRRRGMATTLLKGADLRASDWEFKYLVLHAYENDAGARKLYSKSGYKAVALDPAWTTTWIGRRRRVIMAKRVPLEASREEKTLTLN